MQDGPIRTLSDFMMMGRIPDCASNPSRLCPLPDFLEQVEYELNDPKWRPECFFNGTVRPTQLTAHSTAGPAPRLGSVPRFSDRAVSRDEPLPGTFRGVECSDDPL